MEVYILGLKTNLSNISVKPKKIFNHHCLITLGEGNSFIYSPSFLGLLLPFEVFTFFALLFFNFFAFDAFLALEFLLFEELWWVGEPEGCPVRLDDGLVVGAVEDIPLEHGLNSH